MDRYLAVSNGYHHHAELRSPNWNSPETDESSRQARLLRQIETLDLEPSRHLPRSVEPIDEEYAMGQSVTPTAANLEETKRHQDLLRERLQKNIDGSVSTPGNYGLLLKKLALPPEEFLALFESVTFAWDTLVELGSLAVLPNPQTIQAREMLLIQTTDLEAHLRNMLSATMLSERAPNERVEVAIIESVSHLAELESRGELTQWLVRTGIAQDPSALLNLIVSYIEPHLSEIAVGFKEEIRERSDDLRRKRDGFNDVFYTSYTVRRAIHTVDAIVSFGLRIGYALWFASSLRDETSRAALRKNVLFCTRTLLDERRWAVARDVATFGIELVHADNRSAGRVPSSGTAMLRANALWAASQLNESIEVEVREWDTTGLHKRYEFLKDVLLNDYSNALLKARDLLKPEESTGFPNMCMGEMREWPILEGFRESAQFKTEFGDD